MKKLILALSLATIFTTCVDESKSKPQNCVEERKASHYPASMHYFFEVRNQTTGVYDRIYVHISELPALYKNAKVGDILCY